MKKIVQERFKQVFADAELVYWDDSETILKEGLGPEVQRSIPPRFVRVDKSVAERLIHPDTIGYFSKDHADHDLRRAVGFFLRSAAC